MINTTTSIRTDQSCPAEISAVGLKWRLPLGLDIRLDISYSFPITENFETVKNCDKRHLFSTTQQVVKRKSKEFYPILPVPQEDKVSATLFMFSKFTNSQFDTRTKEESQIQTKTALQKSLIFIFSHHRLQLERGTLQRQLECFIPKTPYLFCPISNQLNFGCTFREIWKAANRSHQGERGAYKTTHDNQGLLHLSKQALIFWQVPHIQQPSDVRDIFQLLSILKCQCKQNHQHRFHLNQIINRLIVSTDLHFSMYIRFLLTHPVST